MSNSPEHEKHRNMSRCIDDSDEPEFFTDVLSRIREKQHIDKPVDNASVGTEEALAERDALNIDGV